MANKNVGGIEWLVDADTTGAVTSMGSVNSTIDKTENKFKKLDTQTTKTAKGVNKAIGGMGRKAGQAGIQMQQFIGQIQGGQNAMLALSAQSADLGFVLGAPLLGAVAGITASLLGMLVPALFASGESAADLTDKIKELVKASTLTEAQSKFMVDQTNDEIKANKKLIDETTRKLKQNEAIINNYDELAKRQKESNDLNGDEIATLKMMGSIVKTARKDNIQYAAAIDTLKGKQEELTKQKKAYSAATIKSEEDQEAEAKSLAKYNSVVTVLEQALAVASREAVGMKAAAADLNAEFKAENMLGGDATKEQIKEVVSLLKEVAIAQEEASKLGKTKIKAEVIDKTYGDPVATLQAQKDEELKILEQAEMDGLQLHSDYVDLKKAIDDTYDEKLAAAREAKFAAESEMNAASLAAIDMAGAAATNMLTGLIDGTMSAKEAMVQLGNTIINEAVGALVQMGVQYVKNALIEQTADQTTEAAKAAMMTANAATHTAAVTATVSELASLATAAGIASTAAIPIVGPGLAPAAGASMGAATLAAGSAAIAAAPIAGMRENGGSVLGGKTYEVGEKNKPEMLMIPGNNGKVFSNAEMKSAMGGNGGTTLNQTINNTASADGYEVQSRGDGVNAPQVIDIVRSEMGNANSYSRRQLATTSNVQNRQRSRR